ncbi:MAG: hypothetical protein IH585_13750 [Anaerolineaceae bacterium]|nr:hypothetical protein [Anaerolineaceae bacterium]
MENRIKFYPDLGNIAKSAYLIEKVHNCADCPIRKLAIKQPKSIFAKLHAWHKIWWPAWKSHQVRTCAYANQAGTEL